MRIAGFLAFVSGLMISAEERFVNRDYYVLDFEDTSQSVRFDMGNTPDGAGHPLAPSRPIVRFEGITNEATYRGRHSMKIITADYQDLVREQSSKKPNAVSIRIDNVDLLPGQKKSFQFTFPNCYAHHLGKFNASYNYLMNYHWRVFRAKAATARIEVTDWKSETDPGGPAGQELIINFIELQPYIGE
tara:strand:+ start:318 stop:881 length:564 start_codon:yes stop_codon:yes gene_type:complete